MAIQNLPPDQSVLSRILGGLGQGLGQSIPQGVDTGLLNRSTQGIDMQQDPMAFLQAIQQSYASPQAKQPYIQALNNQANKNTELQQRKETRLQKQDVGSQYQRLINDIQDNLKTGVLTNTKEAKKAIGLLRKEQQLNLGKIDAGEKLETDAITKYFDQFVEKEEEKKPGILDRVSAFFSPDKDEQAPTEKVAFDPNNQEHLAISSGILEKAGGDKDAANKLMSEMFE